MGMILFSLLSIIEFFMRFKLFSMFNNVTENIFVFFSGFVLVISVYSKGK